MADTTTDPIALTLELQAVAGDELGREKPFWMASLSFKVSPIYCSRGVVPDTLPTAEFYDICSFLPPNKSSYSRLYLDPTVYPGPASLNWKGLPILSGSQDEAILKRLITDIERASYAAGNPIHRNGGGNFRRVFHCNHCRGKKENTKKTGAQTAKTGLFDDTYVGNDGTGTSPGSNGKRTSPGNSAAGSNKNCPFAFTLKWDAAGYYISLGAGFGFHRNHIRVDPATLSIPKKLIPDEDGESTDYLTHAEISSSTGAHIIHGAEESKSYPSVNDFSIADEIRPHVTAFVSVLEALEPLEREKVYKDVTAYMGKKVGESRELLRRRFKFVEAGKKLRKRDGPVMDFLPETDHAIKKTCV